MRELTLPAPLVLLPGLGADAELFSPQRDAFGDAVHVPDWIAPADEGESLASYAERWAPRVNEMVKDFRDDRPWFFGGASMGGMLALEMTPHLDRLPGAVMLIASSRTTPDYSPLAKISAAVMRRLPAKLGTYFGGLTGIGLGIRDGLDDRGYKTLGRMGKAADPARMRWALGAAVEWTYDGPPQEINGQPFPPIHQVHGRKDWIIPLIEDDVDTVVERGRHVLTLSHPKTVNRWLFDHIVEHCGIDESADPRVEDPDVTAMRRPELAMRY